MMIHKLKEKLQNAVQAPVIKITVDSIVREERYNICNKCDYFITLTSTCKSCGCFMNAKTWLSSASCPEGKWSSVNK